MADTPSPSAPSDYPPLAAHYQEIRRSAGQRETSDWYFIRQANQVETARADVAEVWRRDARGEITLTRVFHADRKLIEYSAGELRTQGRQPDWSWVNGIIDPRRHPGLKPVGDTSVLGRPAIRYGGKIGEEHIEIVWLVREFLVARVVRSGRDGSAALELKALQATPDPHWPRANLPGTGDYDSLDAADLGDMEYDPFVQRVLGLDKHPGNHAHAAPP